MSEQPDEDAFDETADDVDAPRDHALDDAVDVGTGPDAEDGPEDGPEVDPGEGPEDVLADEPSDDVAVAATGHPAVDEVLRSLEGLDGRPVDEHVAAYEQAHDQLRRALSDAGDDTP
jgi:hypothetical protein